MAKKKRRPGALKRWARKKKTRELFKFTSRHFGKERGRRVAIGLRAWALGISIRQLTKRGRKARRKKR
ncbi:MAG: hypothetical protein KAT69_09210 [Candidatus Aminicenantes bacterium]|nr:hypothetical protein [Candidatus Aminicenantes bacterium]